MKDLFRRSLVRPPAINEQTELVAVQANIVFSLICALTGDEKISEEILKKSALRTILKKGSLTDELQWLSEAWEVIDPVSVVQMTEASRHSEFWKLPAQTRFLLMGSVQFDLDIEELASITRLSSAVIKKTLDDSLKSIIAGVDLSEITSFSVKPVEVSL